MSTVALSHFNAGAVKGRSEYFINDGEHAEGTGSGGVEDYYIGAVDDLGGSAWVGKGAEVLGLTGRKPNSHDFEAVFSGCDPSTGERLRQGAPKESERAGYELAFNVDKSISALYAIADGNFKSDIEKAILSAHDATLEAMSEKGIFYTRRGKGGAIKEQTENIVAARFLHGTSRNQDPHLHVHCEIAAIVKNDSGKWSTLDASELFKRQQETKFLFDVALAEKLQELGLSIGENDHGVTVNGIEQALLDQWSSRRREILEELQEIGISGSGNRETNLAVTIAGRQKKDEALNREELFNRWHGQAAEHGYEQDFIDQQKALDDTLRAHILTDELESELLQNRSVFMSRDFDRVAARYTIGRGGLSAVDQVKKELIERLDVVRLTDDLFTTRRMVQCETAVMKSAIGRQDEIFHRLAPETVAAKIDQVRESAKAEALAQGRNPDDVNGLNAEQIDALYHLAAHSGGISVLEGAAGTGKSYTMKAVRQLYQEAGFSVVGLAPSGKAAAELQAGSGITSQTAHSLLLQLENGKAGLSEKSVLVLDEAGMVDTVTLARIVDYAHEAGSKLILSGDSKQLEAVGTANLLRDIGQEIGNAELIQIARQDDKEKRAVSQSFFENRGGAAIRKMAEQGMIQQCADPGSQLKAAVELYLKNCDGRESKESLLLADSREQVSKLNDLVRKALVVNGRLNPDLAVKVDLTDDADRVREEVLMPGDRVMFRENNRELRVTNGTTATVESITGNQLSVRLDDGTHQDIDLAEYNRLDIAYAMTVHKSQGMTVDKAVYVTSERTDSRAAYVSYTRARDGGEFVTTHDHQELAERTSKLNEKMSVVGAFEDKETGTNKLLDAIRSQAAQSEHVAQLENRNGLAVKNVLAQEYRSGVKNDLEGVYTGETIGLRQSQKAAVIEAIEPGQPMPEANNLQAQFEAEREAALLRAMQEMQKDEMGPSL